VGSCRWRCTVCIFLFFPPFITYLYFHRSANDKDNPIAASHKGPTIFYLASVSNAASASPSGLKWFKVAEDGLDQSAGTWGVDRMIANGGWVDFTLPSCVAPGQYLLRAEIIALHSASKQGQAQFYMVCLHLPLSLPYSMYFEIERIGTSILTSARAVHKSTSPAPAQRPAPQLASRARTRRATQVF
jgi:hypothetical protein